MLQEISRTTVPIYRNDDVSMFWHNSVLTVSTEKEIYFFEFSHNLQCLFKKIDLLSSSIAVSKSSPLTDYIPKHFLAEDVRNIDHTEMILDPAFWPHNPHMVKEMTNIADLQWSPVGFLPGNESALAVVNNIGNVDVYKKGRCDWSNILDLSNFVTQKYFESDERKNPKTLEQLKALAYTLETSAICWGSKINDNSCLFATAQKNGNILFWTFTYQNSIQPKCLGEIQTEIGEAVTMTWIQKTDKNSLLICSNVYGQIFTLDCCLADDYEQVQIVNQSVIWQQKDKMITKYICYKIINDNIVLLCNKNRHLILLVIDKTCQVLKQIFRNVNDYRITDIKLNDYGIWLTTVNSKIYKVLLKGSASDLDFDLELEETNDSYPTYEMYGIAFSTNNMIWATVLKNRKTLYRQRAQKTVDVVFFYATNMNPDELALLMKQNQTQKLTDFWDCIELLRYKIMKTKTLLSIDYNSLYEESDMDIYKLKLYHMFLNFFLSIEKLAKNKERITLPVMSLDVIKEKILALHARQLIRDYHENLVNNEEMLDTIQLESYLASKRYLVYYCTKYKRDVDEFVTITNKKLLGLAEVDQKIICQCCDEYVNGFTCKSGHFNMFCALTFTPIDSYDYLVCRSCHLTARIELYPNNPKCVFCDLYLSKSLTI